MHVAGICLGTIQARTHVQLAVACQQSMIRAQHRLRLTMQHVFGLGGNLGNECACHAAALGTFGLISSHNVASRRIHHNSDTSVCFDGCNNISETLERLQHIRTNAATLHQDRVLALLFSSCSLCPLCTSRELSSCFFNSLRFLHSLGCCFPNKWWTFFFRVLPQRVSTITPGTMWNPLFELLVFEHVNGIVDSYLVDFDLAQIAFSCHFALDLLCYQEEMLVSAR